MLEERCIFSFEITKEQEEYVEKLVDFSIKNHKVPDIFDKIHQKEYRTTGTMGEVVFADIYNLKRPEKSFGADDGQDMGRDFILNGKSIDIKTMRRKNENFYNDFVLNIPSSQLNKKNSLTDFYCCLSLIKNDKWRASIIGFIDKNKIISGEIGIFYPKGSIRTKNNGETFTFKEDTYEIKFSEIIPPIITDNITQLPNFKKIYLKNYDKNC